MTGRMERLPRTRPLLVKNTDTLKDFPFVSRSCREAMLSLKTNPRRSASHRATSSDSSQTSTRWSSTTPPTSHKQATIPDTATALVVRNVGDRHPNSIFRYADRVVELRCSAHLWRSMDVSFLPRLERLTVDLPPNSVALPRTGSNA